MTELEAILLESQNDYMKYSRRSLASRQTLIRNNYEVLVKLQELGLYTGSICWFGCYCPTEIRVQVSDLPKLRTKFDKVKALDAYEVYKASDNTVKVRLDLGPGDKFVFYVRQLEEDSKCKIVRTTSVETQLICERGQ